MHLIWVVAKCFILSALICALPYHSFSQSDPSNNTSTDQQKEDTEAALSILFGNDADLDDQEQFVNKPNAISKSFFGPCGIIISDDFEAGYGNWNDGGGDCFRLNSTVYANSGTVSVRLRDNSGSSFMTSDPLDLSMASSVTISFSYIANSMENGEDFWLQMSTNGGAFITMEDWIRNIDFDNNVRYNEQVTINGPFTSNIRFRFRCDASSNFDQVYIDDVVVEVPCSNDISGTVYDDTDIDGTLDGGESGIAGVDVFLYSGQSLIDQKVTDGAGQYFFDNLTAGDSFKVVFANFPGDYTPSILGPDNGGPVQTAVVGGASVSLGLYDPGLLCEDNPYIIIPCYVEGQYFGGIANDAAIVKLPSTADGHHFNGAFPTAAYEGEYLATYGQVGTVYGIAWDPLRRKIYASSFHKRYSGYGPGGADAIYSMDMNGNSIKVISLDSLLGLTGTTGGDVHDFLPSGNGHVYDLGPGDVSLDAVGKRAFGDIDISGDFSTLYVVNLFDRRIYALDVSSGVASQTTVVNSWASPDGTGNARHRPFGLAWHNNLLWIGSVDENGQNAFVHSLNPSTGTTSLALTIPPAISTASLLWQCQ